MLLNTARRHNKKTNPFSKKKVIVSLISLIILIPAFFAGLIFITKVEPRMQNGEMDLQNIKKETVYLFGEWQQLDSHILPQSDLWNDSEILTINTNRSANKFDAYSLRAEIKNLDTQNDCLMLYNIKYVDRIYVNQRLIYNANEDIKSFNSCVPLKDLIHYAPFTITVWVTGGYERQSMQYPLTLMLTHQDNAAMLFFVRIVLKYIIVGLYAAFALICLVMYLNNKTEIHFLLLSLSGLIRMLALESYLAPCLLLSWLGLSEIWILRTSMIFISLANILNVGVIYTLYKRYMLKKATLFVLIIVNIFLLLTLITGSSPFGLILNIAGYILYFLCLIAVGRAWISGEKSARWMFTAFFIYMISLLFFYATRSLAGMGSALGVFNFVCPVGEFLFYAVTIFAFFVRYVKSYIQNRLKIQSLDTQLSDKEQSLIESYKKLSEFEAARTRMLRDLSHDLRTPVTSVLGYLSMMAAGEIAEQDDVKSISGKMLLRVRQIKDMTNSISGLTTLEQGQLKMQLRPCSVSDIMKTVLIHNEHKCKDAGLDFTARSNCNAQALADMQQIMRVFDNLISNAIRHTPSGGIITVSAEAEGDSVRFSVTDTGCGIPKAQQSHVFERFYRGETSRTENAVHQGLGLAICYEIIKAHHGAIGVISEEDKGSEFYFTLKTSSEE